MGAVHACTMSPVLKERTGLEVLRIQCTVLPQTIKHFYVILGSRQGRYGIEGTWKAPHNELQYLFIVAA